MKILAIEKELKTINQEQMKAYLVSEASEVWELFQKDVIREIYFQKEQHLAVLILECADLIEARTVIRSLPLVKAGLIDFTLLDLIPYDGFARLFASTHGA